MAPSDPDGREFGNEFEDELNISAPGAVVAGEGDSVAPGPDDAEFELEVLPPETAELEEEASIGADGVGVSDPEFSDDVSDPDAETAIELDGDSVLGAGVRAVADDALAGEEAEVETDAEFVDAAPEPEFEIDAELE